MLAPSPYPLTPNLKLNLPLPYPALKALRERRGPRLPRRAPATRRGSSESIAESCVLPRQEEGCCPWRATEHGCLGASAGALLVWAEASGSRFRIRVTCVLSVRSGESGVGTTLCARDLNVHICVKNVVVKL